MDFFVGGTIVIIFIGLIFIFSILWIIALIDIIRSDFIGENDKLLWALIVLFSHILGAILYFIIGRTRKVNRY